MLSATTVDLPRQIEAKLLEQSAFSQSLLAFSLEQLAGLHRPVAAAAALIGPVLIAFTFAVSDVLTALETGSIFAATGAAFLVAGWYVNRGPLQEAYHRSREVRRRARLDLRERRGKQIDLSLEQKPVFYEHRRGVIALAPVNARECVFFDIDGSGEDPRWFFYVNGDMHRQRWRWLRLSGSGAVMGFEASGERLYKHDEAPFTDAEGAEDAISLALGEPCDGDIIAMPFDHAVSTVNRLLGVQADPSR